MAVKDLTHEAGISDEEIVRRVSGGETYLLKSLCGDTTSVFFVSFVQFSGMRMKQKK